MPSEKGTLPGETPRSRRRESALIHCFKNKQVRRLTSAATRFLGREHLQNSDVSWGHELWGETPSSPDLSQRQKLGLDGVSPHQVHAGPRRERVPLSANRSVGLAAPALASVTPTISPLFPPKHP